jgi:branched-chain amino acid transport system substrate-binding protein
MKAGMADYRGRSQAGIKGLARAGGLRLGALALATLLAACQGVVPKREAPTAPPPPVTTGPVVQPGLPTDTARHRVALLVPLTGSNAGVGKSIANAVMMAQIDTKTERLRITTYDTGSGAAAAASRAIADGTKLILGPLTAEEVRAVAPVAQAANVPLVSFSNDTGVAGNGTYLMGFAPTQSVERIVAYARGRGMSKFAALVPKGVYGERTGGAFLRAVQASGATMVAMESFDRSPGSLTAAVKRLPAGTSYDALLIADAGRIAIQAAPLVRTAAGAGPRLLGTELWNTESGLGANPALRGAWFASVSDGLYQTLATKYRATYGTGAYRLSSLGYDSVLLAVRIAADWKPGTDFPVARLTDADGFAGIDGAFRFRKDSIAERALEVQEVGPSGTSIIDPAPRGFSR